MTDTFAGNTEKIVEVLRKIAIVPVLVLDDADQGMKMCETLLENGLPAAEITFRTDAAEEIIADAARRFPELALGAGTILNTEDLGRAFGAGARFAVAPGFNPRVIERAVEKGWPFMPGIATPSEIEQAMSLGVKRFKFFPAEALGGVRCLKSIAAPYRHLGIGFMPTGGVSPDNVDDYLAMPEVVACGGTWLGKSDDVRAGRWDKIEALVKDAAKRAR